MRPEPRPCRTLHAGPPFSLTQAFAPAPWYPGMSPANRTPLVRFGGVLLLASLVLALGFLANLPAAHALLHEQAHAATRDHESRPQTPAASHEDATCAVTLFAQGLTTPALAPHLLPPQILAEVAPIIAPSTPIPLAPPRLHPPAQAPPTTV